MKKSLLTLGMLAWAASAAFAAQQYGYVGNATGGTVTVFDPSVPALLGAPVNPVASGLSNPRASVAVSSLNRVYVVNSGNFRVTVIDGSTLQVVNTILLPNGDVANGICVSEDQSAIFVAGHNALLGEAGVWQISLPAETAVWAAGIVDAAPAIDCEVIRSGLIGGSGSAPGKVYWTVSATSYIGFKSLSPALPVGSLNVPAASAATPTLIERAPDSSFMLFGVVSALAGNAIGRIVPGAADTLTVISMGGAVGGSTRDIAFNPGVTPFRTFVLGNEGGSNRVYDMSTSAGLGVFAPVNTAVAPQFGLNISLEPGANRVWLGDSSGTANQVLPLSTTTTPPTAGAGFTTGSGPVRVAFLPVPPAPTLDEACPKGQADVATARIRLRGSNFVSTSQIRFGLGAGTIAIPTTFVDANTLDGDVSGLGSGTFDVIVRNPDLVQARLNSFYRSVLAPGTPSPFPPITLPSVNTGYEMKSFPEYATIDQLKLALQTQLGPYNPNFYRVFFWYTDHYEELNALSTAIDPCDLSGRAFYVLTKMGHPLSLNSLDVTANTPTQLRVVPLMPGWNMFSQPWINGSNRISWANVRVTQNGDLTGQASALGFATLSPLPYQRVSNAYVNVNTLTAGEGYWVHNYHTGPLYLVFDSTLVAKPGVPASVATSMAPGDPGPPPPPSGVASASDGGSGGCGLLGPEFLAVVAAFHALRRRRRLGA